VERERVREAAGERVFAISFSQLVPAFVVLFVGTVLSLVVFIVEFIVNCQFKSKEELKTFVLCDSENFVLVTSLTLQI